MPSAVSPSFRALPWAVVAAACVALLALTAAPPFVAPPWRAVLMEGFHLVCHQLPDRSFAVRGTPLALCHRCTGIVLGLVLGALAVPLLGRSRTGLAPYERLALGVALAMTGADWLLGLSGVWTNTVASRFLTGLLLGTTAGYLLARSVAFPEAAPAEAGRIQAGAAP
jgi:uncharacterized membrane protein